MLESERLPPELLEAERIAQDGIPVSQMIPIADPDLRHYRDVAARMKDIVVFTVEDVPPGGVWINRGEEEVLKTGRTLVSFSGRTGDVRRFVRAVFDAKQAARPKPPGETPPLT